jgi:hypothetical protein
VDSCGLTSIEPAELATDIRFRTYEAPFNSDTFFWTEFTARQGLPRPTHIATTSEAPLPVLEQRMSQFIADGGTNRPR